MGPTNVALVNLFKADQELRGAQAKLDAATHNVRIQERKVADLTARHAASSKSLKEQQAKAGVLDSDIKARDEHIEKLREQQTQARNNKEYQAFLVEINTHKVDRGKIEEETIQVLELVEKLAGETRTLHTMLDAEQAKLTEMRGQIEEKIATLKVEVDSFRPLRDSAAGAVSPKALAIFERTAAYHDGEALASVAKPDRRREEYMCSGCNMDLVVDVYNRLHTRDDVINCPSCGRILFIPEDLPPEMAVGKGRDPAKPEKKTSTRKIKAKSTEDGLILPPKSKDAWTEEEFNTRAMRSENPVLIEKQATLLSALRSITGVTARFDGQGAHNPAYNVYIEGTSRYFLRVNADGRIFAYFSSFYDGGQRDLGDYARASLLEFTLDPATENAVVHEGLKTLAELDVNSLTAHLTSFATKAGERRAGLGAVVL